MIQILIILINIILSLLIALRVVTFTVIGVSLAFDNTTLGIWGKALYFFLLFTPPLIISIIYSLILRSIFLRLHTSGILSQLSFSRINILIAPILTLLILVMLKGGILTPQYLFDSNPKSVATDIMNFFRSSDTQTESLIKSLKIFENPEALTKINVEKAFDLKLKKVHNERNEFFLSGRSPRYGIVDLFELTRVSIIFQLNASRKNIIELLGEPISTEPGYSTISDNIYNFGKTRIRLTTDSSKSNSEIINVSRIIIEKKI